MEIIIILISIGFLYLIFRPKAQPKSKEQKQVEIFESYKKRFKSELLGIEDRALLIEKKTALLKSFSAELNRNLFFDENEVRELIQKLAKYEVDSGN